MNLHEGTLWIQYIKCKQKLLIWEGRKISNEAYRFLNMPSSNFQILAVTTLAGTSAAGLSLQQRAKCSTLFLSAQFSSLQIFGYIPSLLCKFKRKLCKCRSRGKKAVNLHCPKKIRRWISFSKFPITSITTVRTSLL